MFWKIVFGAIIWWIVTFLIIKPFFRLKSLQKKGGLTYFYPLIGALRLVSDSEKKYKDTWGSVKDLIKTNPNARFLASNLGPRIMVNLIDTNLIKLLTQSDKFEISPNTKIFKVLMPNSILMLDGVEWKNRRKLISEAFHYDFLQQMIPKVQNTTLEFIGQWKKEKVQGELNILQEYQNLTGEIVGRIFFGNHFNDQQIDGVPAYKFINDLLVDTITLFYSPFYHFFGWKSITWGLTSFQRDILRRVRSIREFSAKIIRNKKETTDTKSKDLLHILLQYQKNGESLSEDDIIDEFLTFFLAGMDTTAHLLTAATYFANKYPKFKSELLDDIKKHIVDPKSITLEQLNKLEVVQGFLRESLRLMPPVTLAANKISTVDHYLDDIFLPKGTMVSAVLVANNFNPKIHQNLLEFNPYRWVKGHPDSKNSAAANSDPFSFTPFFAGPRNCIGQHLAMNEAKLIFSLMLLNFDWSIRDDYKIEMKSRVLYEAEVPIPVRLTPIQQ